MTNLTSVGVTSGVPTSGTGTVSTLDGALAYGQLTLVNQGGTITSGGTSQVAITSNAARKYLYVGNPSTEVESLYVNFGAAATAANSIELGPGGSLTMNSLGVSTQSLNLLAATTGHVFVVKEG